MRPFARRSMLLISIILSSLTLVPAWAQDGVVNLGGYTFASGSSLDPSTGSPRDLFAAAFSAGLSGRVQGDLHATGFDVEIASQVGADLYAAGFSVEISGPVGSDVTVAAADFIVNDSASVQRGATLVSDRPGMHEPPAESPHSVEPQPDAFSASSTMTSG